VYGVSTNATVSAVSVLSTLFTTPHRPDTIFCVIFCNIFCVVFCNIFCVISYRPHWQEYRSKKRRPADLDADVLQRVDDITAVDAQLFAAALRLLLGRLRWVEGAAGVSLLECIDWEKLHRDTAYISGLWEGEGGLLVGSESGVN
jgi:hypothetical protein